MVNRHIITLSGYDRCGKDTIAEIMEEKLNKKHIKCKILHFADPIKDIVRTVLDIDEFKFETLLKNKDENTIGIKLNQYGDNFNNSHFKNKSLRESIIKTAKNLKQNFGEDFFAKLVTESLKKDNKTEVFIIPDLRFKIEDKRLETYIMYYNNKINSGRSKKKLIKYTKVFVDSKISSCGKNKKTYDLKELDFDKKITNSNVMSTTYSNVERLLIELGVLGE